MKPRFLLTVVLLAAVPLLAQADAPTAESAQAAYERGTRILAQDPATAQAEFKAAAAQYEELVRDGHTSAALFYNLGAAYAQTGDLGRSIHFLRRAEALAPRDDRIEQLLAQVRGQVNAPKPVSRHEWLDRERLWGGTIPVWVDLLVYLTLCSIVAVTWRFGRRRLAFLLVPLLVASAVLLGFSVWQQADHSLHPPGVVVETESATLRAGNSPYFKAVMDRPLPAGAEFRCLTRTSGWVRIELADGTRGWLPLETTLIDDQSL